MNPTRRYPGSRPFEDNPIDRLLFRGREKEKTELMNLILAYDLVLFYARSGTGKTSLLNAGVLEDLRTQEYFPATVRLYPGNTIKSIRQVILEEARRFGIRVDQVEEDFDDLVLLLSKGRFWRDDVLMIPVLIIDQFEELFTLHEQAGQDRIVDALSRLAGRRLTDTMEKKTRNISDVPYKLVFAVREDYLGELESVANQIPTIMHHRYRLKKLSVEQAIRAIREPAAIENANLNGPTFIYSDEAVELLVAFLARRRERLGLRQDDYIEPFQLQIICQHIEDVVSQRSSQAGSIVINQNDLGGQEGMEKVLERFYNEQIDKLPAELRDPVHELCETGLVSPTGKRISLEEEYIENVFKIEPATLKKLVALRLLRAEPRVGSTYYELSHDTLVGAVERTAAERRPAFLLKRARDQQHAGNFAEALHYYVELINYAPQDHVAYVECAEMLMDHEQHEEAEKVLAAAETNALTHPIINIARGRLFIHLGQTENALAEISQALASDIIRDDELLSAICFQHMGFAYLNDDRNRQAEDYYLKAIELKPEMQNAHSGLLKAMIRLRQFGRVEAHIDTVRQASFYSAIWPDLIKELSDVGASAVAKKILEDALSTAGSDYASVIEVAHSAWSIMEWDVAFAALEAAFRIDPETPHYALRGEALLNLGRFNEAETMYSQALQQNANDIKSLLDRAFCRTWLKRYEEAIEDCQSAVKFEASSPRPFKYWGWCLSDQGQHQDAIEMFAQSDRLHPGDSKVLSLWAHSLNQLSLHEEALQKSRFAIKADNTNSDAFCEYGYSLWLCDQIEEALEKFQTAYALDPQNLKNLVTWGVVLSAKGDFDDASEKFEKAHRLSPTDPYTLWNWGKSLMGSGRYRSAVEKCRQALKLDPQDAEAHHNLALSLDTLGDTETALDHFRKAVDLDPEAVDLRTSLAKALMKQGNYADADEHYHQAAKLAGDDDSLTMVYVDWGYSLGRAGFHKEAEKKFHKVLESNTDIMSLCGIASELADQGRIDEARQYYRQAEKLGPQEAGEFGNLGWGFYQLGDYDKSLKYSRAAIDLDPNALYVRCNIGLVLLRLGKPEMAMQAYEQAMVIAEQTADADEFHYHAVEDVEDALKNAPDLQGGQDILASLKKHHRRIHRLRQRLVDTRRRS